MSEDAKRIVAIVAIVLGIISLAAAICLPICGVFLGFVGAVLGIVAIRSESKVLAIVALAMNLVVIVLSLVIWFLSAAWLMGKVDIPGLPRPRIGPPHAAPLDGGTDTAPLGTSPPDAALLDPFAP